ncbi:vitamin K epoxide reductase family protein [Desertivibrio insolitus]|uniref:vitamin K epoxide reductase family protein n=1 Tax=Herbiconiux sp. SYSU D00978 TaxID=2812562 RepID=UPI001A95A952|nr:vitamin K epoxide reductase family protein [Herbiconiux sp. SYSU D00978]
MSQDERESGREVAFPVFLVLAGALGLLGAFALTVEKFVLLQNPDATLGCDFSLVVQCGRNLSSWQGSLFGFPNPLIGLIGFTAPVVVGVAMLASARFARWFWALFTVGVTGALAFVIWLISQSIFVLGTLCPWCMLVWAVTIPLFWATLLRSVSTEALPLGAGARRVASALYGWVPLITVLSYAVVAVIAQLRLDVLSYL